MEQGMTAYEKVQNCLAQVRRRTDFRPRAAVVLGSGLGDFAERIEVAYELPYSELEGFPVSTVPGHAGKFILGRLGGVPVVCMKGRVHYYEGYDIADVVLPVRLMHAMGAELLILTNAAGGVNTAFRAGDLMLLRDHLALFAPNPLIGPNEERFGVRFPDMSHVYDEELQRLIRDTAARSNIPLREGVYAQLTGPSFETPAEIRALRAMGADAVGMSTAVEAIAARHMGLRVAGISCITNPGAGVTDHPLSHEEVQQAADAAAPVFQTLLTETILSCRRL